VNYEGNVYKQVARLPQRNRAAGWVSCGQN